MRIKNTEQWSDRLHQSYSHATASSPVQVYNSASVTDQR